MEAGGFVWPCTGKRGRPGWGFVGGRAVARILVADDNSNIQKMVGLALKDQGIDVVAVGNGEAAVRKISDIKPDLVLADVFMPVRNGYEVCKYVKDDPALAHIPVILLVGAFDPLDEQEAQRVGADGVLKKPFVPPDPLISMVKSALARAGVPHGQAAAPKAREPEPLKAADLLGPRGAVPVEISAYEVPAEPLLANNSESFVDELPVQPEPVRIESGSQPVAFGSLLETPENEAEADPAFLPPAHPELASERGWRDPDEVEEEVEEEEKPASAWRHEETETFAESSSQGGVAGWRAGSFEQIKTKRSQYEAWESLQENPTVAEAAKAPQEFSGGEKEPPQIPPDIPEPMTEAPATPFSANAWAPAVTTSSPQPSSAKTAAAVEEVAPKMASVSGPEANQAEPEQKNSWFSATSSPWDTDMQRATRLASTWDSPQSVPSTPAAGNGTEQGAPEIPEAATDTVIEPEAHPATVEAIREEAAQVAEDAAKSTVDSAPVESSVAPQPSTAEAPEPMPSMDELVAKVLAKMSPDALQAVTREILKPVIEAMMKEEMKGKKS
jgi:CheY-like chemotaxis protein